MTEELKQKTEEEINKKAEKHCNEVLCNAHEKCNEVIKCRDWRSRRAGFYCGYEQATKELQDDKNKLLDVISNYEVKVADLEKDLRITVNNCNFLNEEYRKLEAKNEKQEKQIEKMKVEKFLSVDFDKAKKNGELCLGYGGDEDEPCEQCKNCIKCETGYYQLLETEKDEQLTEAKEIIREYIRLSLQEDKDIDANVKLFQKAEAFINKE